MGFHVVKAQRHQGVQEIYRRHSEVEDFRGHYAQQRGGELRPDYRNTEEVQPIYLLDPFEGEDLFVLLREVVLETLVRDLGYESSYLDKRTDNFQQVIVLVLPTLAED